MKQEAEAFARELAVLRHLVPTQNEVPSLLESISTAARHAGLELSDVQPDGVVNGDQFDTYRYKLGVTGPYHQVAAFLSNVGSLSRIVAPINLSVIADVANRRGQAEKARAVPRRTLPGSDLRRARVREAAGDNGPSGGAVRRASLAVAALVVSAGALQAQVPGAAAKAAARSAVAATNAHIEAEQNVEQQKPRGEVRREACALRKSSSVRSRSSTSPALIPPVTAAGRFFASRMRSRKTAAAIRSCRCSRPTSCGRR